MAKLDELMEDASAALGRMDYLACERHCLSALAAAREAGEWAYYARILLPLQECRRQRRMIAASGVVRLGTAELASDPSEWISRGASGCLVVTRPRRPEEAAAVLHHARTRGQHFEVLYADSVVSEPVWALRSFLPEDLAPAVCCTVPRPPEAWLDRWIEPAEGAELATPRGLLTPADWFLDATEVLGDAAMAQVRAPLGSAARVAELERCLGVVTDHEILHQRLAEAARACGRSGGQ